MVFFLLLLVTLGWDPCRALGSGFDAVVVVSPSGVDGAAETAQTLLEWTAIRSEMLEFDPKI